MRNTYKNMKPVRATTDKNARVLRALWRILASRGARAAEAPPVKRDNADDLEWHLRMMS